MSDIARRAGIERSNVSRILSGERQANFKLETLERIADAMGQKPWQLLYMVEYGLTEFPPPDPTPSNRRTKR